MKRIIMHWTAGNYKPNATDLKHYHFLIDGDGNVVPGKFPISANSKANSPLKSGKYAAHTANCNTGSIGISVCGMMGAQERPFHSGKAPMKQIQIDALVKEVARLSKEYGIPVTPQTILSHAEVQQTLGIPQRNKWDIMWLPGLPATDSAIKIGNILRDKIAMEVQGKSSVFPDELNFLERFFNFIINLFKGNKS